MHFAIVDDRQDERENLLCMLERYFTSHNVSVQIESFPSGDAFLEKFKPGMFQCVFLDIYMDGTDGMDTARIIYEEDPACKLIFCTTSITHAVTSYEVRAAWYLVKPFTDKRLADALNATCMELMKNSRALTLHIKGNLLNLRFADIYYMDCANRQARIHLKDRCLFVDESVSELGEKLTTDERFLTCNRNTIVNMDHIKLVEEDDFRLHNDECVPIKLRGRAALKKEFLAWSLRELRRGKHL